MAGMPLRSRSNGWKFARLVAGLLHSQHAQHAWANASRQRNTLLATASPLAAPHSLSSPGLLVTLALQLRQRRLGLPQLALQRLALAWQSRGRVRARDEASRSADAARLALGQSMQGGPQACGQNCLHLLAGCRLACSTAAVLSPQHAPRLACSSNCVFSSSTCCWEAGQEAPACHVCTASQQGTQAPRQPSSSWIARRHQLHQGRGKQRGRPVPPRTCTRCSASSASCSLLLVWLATTMMDSRFFSSRPEIWWGENWVRYTVRWARSSGRHQGGPAMAVHGGKTLHEPIPTHNVSRCNSPPHQGVSNP